MVLASKVCGVHVMAMRQLRKSCFHGGAEQGVTAGLGTWGAGGLGVKHLSLSQTWVRLPAQSQARLW